MNNGKSRKTRTEGLQFHECLVNRTINMHLYVQVEPTSVNMTLNAKILSRPMHKSQDALGFFLSNGGSSVIQPSPAQESY